MTNKIIIDGEEFEYSTIKELERFRMRKRIERYNSKFPNGTYRIGIRNILFRFGSDNHRPYQIIELSYEEPKRLTQSIYYYNHGICVRLDTGMNKIEISDRIGGLYDKVYSYSSLHSFLNGCYRHEIPYDLVIKFKNEYSRKYGSNTKFYTTRERGVK